MKKKRFSTEQIAAVLHQAEQGIPVGELCRQVGISEQASRQAYVRAKRSLLSELAATGAAVLNGGDYAAELS